MKFFFIQTEWNKLENKNATLDESEEIGTPFTNGPVEALDNLLLARKSVYSLEEILDLTDEKDEAFYADKVNNYIKNCNDSGYEVKCMKNTPPSSKRI